MIFLDTYFIFLRTTTSFGPSIIQAFAPPPDSAPRENGLPALFLTHECTTNADIRIRTTRAMQSRMDPTTGSTHISLLDCGANLEKNQFFCINRTLSKHSAADISPAPITINLHGIHLPTMKPLQLRSYYDWDQYMDMSQDGYIRGFFLYKPKSKRIQRPWKPNQNQHVMKFTIDGTCPDPSQWTVTCGQNAPAEWSDEVDPGKHPEIEFDGMRGRLCYHHPADEEIVVLDVV